LSCNKESKKIVGDKKEVLKTEGQRISKLDDFIISYDLAGK
jgi:hypothetical protein